MENAALRLQLAAFQRKRKRPVLTTFDRWFWVGLCRVWNGWRGPLFYVQPDTVVQWQRERQAMSDSSAGLEYRQDHRDPATGRPASPL
jgi:hypothetical protein